MCGFNRQIILTSILLPPNCFSKAHFCHPFFQKEFFSSIFFTDDIFFSIIFWLKIFRHNFPATNFFHRCSCCTQKILHCSWREGWNGTFNMLFLAPNLTLFAKFHHYPKMFSSTFVSPWLKLWLYFWNSQNLSLRRVYQHPNRKY